MGYSKTTNAAKEPVTLEMVESLFSFLQGEDFEGITVGDKPKLKPSNAFSVIYFLQEQMNLLPDSFEYCSECECLFDSTGENSYLEPGNVCVKCGRTPCKKCCKLRKSTGHVMCEACLPAM